MSRTSFYLSLLMTFTLLLGTTLPRSVASQRVPPISLSSFPGFVHSSAARRTLGKNVLVGSFTLHVQIQQQRVTVASQGGSHAADLAVSQLQASFVNWNPTSKIATVRVAIENVGTTSLVGPINVVIAKIASPQVDVVNADGGPGLGSFSYGPSQLGPTPNLSPGETSSGKEWQFRSATAKAFQVDVDVIAGVPLAPGVGATIEGQDGTSVTVLPNSIPYEVLIDSQAVSASAVKAPLGTLQFAGAMNVVFEPTTGNTDLAPPSASLILSMPAPANPDTANFVVAQQLLVDAINVPEPGLMDQLVASDTATLVNGAMVTQANILPGIFGGGLFVFVANHGSGFATGIVSDASGARPGAVVSNNTNTLVSIADGIGAYHLYINGGPFTVTAFDPLKGSQGSSASSISTSGSTVNLNIPVMPLATPPVTRDGIRNGGLERGDLTSWAATGAASARQQLGPTSTGVVIRPTEGQFMADISTGDGSIGGTGSSLKQRFIVPAGVQTLRFDFNFVSEEFPEFVGSVFDDSFRAAITTENGTTTFAQVSVNQSGNFTLIGDCGFPGGDSTCGQTGWREGSVNLSAFAGTGTPVSVDLIYSANDAGDNIYDTHVLLDNMRFSTVFIDANIINGATADRARVEQEIRNANEVLSQAGINLQLRDVQTVADPGALLDLDATFTGTLTAEENSIVGLSRSGVGTDMNYYYVRSLTGISALAIALGPDDFSDVNILTNSGILMTDTVTPETLAHELGHILISPDTAGSVLEHNAGVASNIMNTPRTVPRNLVNRQQSANINRAGAPLLRP